MKTRFLLPSLALAVTAGLIFTAQAQDKKPEAPAKDKEPAKEAAPTPAPAPAAKAADLTDPTKLTEKAPATFKAKFETTKGSFVIKVDRESAPIGADRFFNLVKAGYFKDVAFFRVISGFMAQFGIHGDPKVSAAWKSATIQDDPVKSSNVRGAITYAKSRLPNSRSTQFFINFGDNSSSLDSTGFASFGSVVEGMDVVDKLNSEYGEGAPAGRGPNQMLVQSQGNTYLKAKFPNLDYIKSATIVE